MPSVRPNVSAARGDLKRAIRGIDSIGMNAEKYLQRGVRAFDDGKGRAERARDGIGAGVENRPGREIALVVSVPALKAVDVCPVDDALGHRIPVLRDPIQKRPEILHDRLYRSPSSDPNLQYGCKCVYSTSVKEAGEAG